MSEEKEINLIPETNIQEYPISVKTPQEEATTLIMPLVIQPNRNIDYFAVGAVLSITGYDDFLFNTILLGRKTLSAVLLYTDEDSILKEYIKKHFQEFHKLSGDWCKIFVLEKPDKKWICQNLTLYERFKLKFFSDIDKSEAYIIARELKIQANQIPCLVFFGKEMNSQRLIIPIKEASLTNLSKYFRELFTMLEKILASAANSTVESLSGATAFETISHRFDDILNCLDKYAQEIVSQNQHPYQQQIIIAEKLMMENKSVTNNLQESQIAGGIVNAETVTSQQIGGNIQNTESLER